MIKLSENKIYNEVLNNFKINNIDCELSINTKTNEFKIESLYFFTNSNMVSIRFYSFSISVYIIKGKGNEKISEEFERDTDIEIIIDKIKEILEV